MEPMTYAGTGVSYEMIDPFKIMAQRAARETSHQLERFGYREVEWTRGESCYLYETPTEYRGHVNEGLGTRNLVADAMYQLTGRSYYQEMGRSTVATIVNDMITVGCFPITLNMHVAAGRSEWFEDERRCKDLVAGWKAGCDLAYCTWAGGETPTLKGMVESDTVILSGSADGEVKPKRSVINPANIGSGDAIVLIESSGVHDNGLTFAREIGKKLPEGYLTRLSDDRTYGETLLDSTYIYVGLVESCLEHQVSIHYAVVVTGHGWRKLMRAPQPWTYVIENLPTPLPIFDFIQKWGPVDDVEAYSIFNMGAGLALYVKESDVHEVFEVARKLGFRAFAAGHIEKGEKKVVIKPKDITFDAASLAVR